MNKDVIIIFGGGMKLGNFLPDIVKYRIKKGVELYKKGITKDMVFSGGHWIFSLDETYSKTEAETMKKYAISLGVDEENIYLEEKSKDTITNIYFIKKLLKEHNWKKLIFITSDFHMNRIKYVSRKILSDEYVIDFIESDSRLSERKLKKQTKKEKMLLILTKRLLRNIKSGDDVAIKRFLEMKYYPCLKLLRFFHYFKKR